jgi:hypothetical protein
MGGDFCGERVVGVTTGGEEDELDSLAGWLATAAAPDRAGRGGAVGSVAVSRLGLVVLAACESGGGGRCSR